MRIILACALVVGVSFGVCSPARAQIGTQVGCFSAVSNDPEVACVGEQVRCLARFLNQSADGETWLFVAADLTVHHPSGDEASGNLVPTPVSIAAPDGFGDGTFLWTTRPEDVGLVVVSGHTAAQANGGTGEGFFQAQVQVMNCDAETRAARRAAFLATDSYLVRCMPSPQFPGTIVCNKGGVSFTAQVH